MSTVIISWNPLVNRKFLIEGDFGFQDGYFRTLQFESGKKRTFLNNSYIPYEFPSLKLALDNIMPTESDHTEYWEFMNWYSHDVRYGILSFTMPRISWKRKWYTKTDEMGIYSFIPNSLKIDKPDGIVMVSFGLEEVGIIPEVEHTFLTTNNEVFIIDNGKFIAI